MNQSIDLCNKFLKSLRRPESAILSLSPKIFQIFADFILPIFHSGRNDTSTRARRHMFVHVFFLDPVCRVELTNVHVENFFVVRADKA